jgi:hypothetical protein
MSNNLPDISISDFAMDIISDMAKNPAKALKPALKESTVESLNVPDISNVEVSQDFVSLVTEGKKPSVKQQPKNIVENKQEKLEDLVNKLSSLLGEARELIQEMTSVGSIGVNTMGRATNKKVNKGKYLLKYHVSNKVSKGLKRR